MRKIKIHQAFTLVELVIVITILAILATIAFLSFQGYNKGARDSNRLTTIQAIKKGIDAYTITVGNVPMVDDKTGTGTINGNAVTYVGVIGDTITKLVRINRVPTDPATGVKYVYGVDVGQQKYQIGTVVEDLQSNNFLFSQVYADGGLKAKVKGNYQGLLKYSGKIYNIPSLLITFSGTTDQDLLTGSTNYVIDNGKNLPYLISGATQLNTLTPTQVLQKLTNTGANLTVTGITIPTDITTWNSSSGSLQTNLGYNIETIGENIFGNDYFISIKNNTNNSLSGGIITCNAGQGYNGTSCITATQCTTGLQNITLSNNQTWSCLNLGATTVRNGTTQPTNCGGVSTTNCNPLNTFIGDYYQWGRNEPVNTTTTVATYNGTFNGTLGHNNFVIGNATYGDWWQNEAGSSTSTRWSGLNPQGPCPTGWHVPSQAEWKTACNTISGTNCANNSTTVIAMTSVLKLPFTGYRNRTNGNYYNQGNDARYWSSNPNTTSSYGLYFTVGNISPAYDNVRGIAFGVRCIEN